MITVRTDWASSTAELRCAHFLNSLIFFWLDERLWQVRWNQRAASWRPSPDWLIGLDFKKSLSQCVFSWRSKQHLCSTISLKKSWLSCLHCDTLHTHCEHCVFLAPAPHIKRKENVLLLISNSILPQSAVKYHWQSAGKVQLLWAEGPFCCTVDGARPSVIIFQRTRPVSVWSYWVRVDCKAFFKPNKRQEMHHFSFSNKKLIRVRFKLPWEKGAVLISHTWLHTVNMHPDRHHYNHVT